MEPRRSQRIADAKAVGRSQATGAASTKDDDSCNGHAPTTVAERRRERERARRLARVAQLDDTTPTSKPAPRKRAVAGAGVPGSSEARPSKRQAVGRAEPALTGLWDVLPAELLSSIVDLCTPRQLAMLETTCRYFYATPSVDPKCMDSNYAAKPRLNVEAICEGRLAEISRAKGLQPVRTAGERWSSLLHFINAQSVAAAQATALAFGGYHTAALLVETDGFRDHPHSLFTWGKGFHGALGHGDYGNIEAPKTLCLGYAPCADSSTLEEEITAAVVACGTDHTATISRRGQLFTWGLGNSGELAHEEVVFLDMPSPVRAYLCQAEHIRIVSVACGNNHTLAIAENGALWSCGRNNAGQLGNGTSVDSPTLNRVGNLPRGVRIVSAGAGALHSMALASDGSLFTWGDSRYGQLGHIHLMQPGAQNPVQRWPLKIAELNPITLKPYNRVTAISCGMWHGMAVTVGGSVLAFGRNHKGQLGTGDKDNRWQPVTISLAWDDTDPDYFRAAQVACGMSHSMVLVAHKGRLTACTTGYNYFGQLGLGDREDRLSLRPVKCLRDPVALVAGEHNSGCINGDGTIHFFGRNDHGQLGLGDDRSRLVPTLLRGFKAVHPDRTLRKSKRSAPRMRRRLEDTDQQLQAKSASPEAECQAKVATRGATPPQQQPAQQQIIPVPAA